MSNPQKHGSAITHMLDSEMKPETARMAAGGVTLGHGQAVVKAGGTYQTAVMVQVKRDIGTPDSPGGSVLSRSTTEAKLLKERFFYGWDVNCVHGCVFLIRPFHQCPVYSGLVVLASLD